MNPGSQIAGVDTYFVSFKSHKISHDGLQLFIPVVQVYAAAKRASTSKGSATVDDVSMSFKRTLLFFVLNLDTILIIDKMLMIKTDHIRLVINTETNSKMFSFISPNVDISVHGVEY